MSLTISTVLELKKSPDTFKLHLACWNQKDHPLDVFVRDPVAWDGWNAWRGNRDDFSRPSILSFMEFYHEPDTWLFGGIYDVLAREAPRYKIRRQPEAFLLEKYIGDIHVSELLRESYSGRAFPGYENVSHPFHELESIIRNSRPDWKAALENVKGVYLVVDTSNGKRYVGSAYGDTGLWSRWSCYISTGHGWNDELTSIISRHGIDYARQHFRFVLLEHRPMKVEDRAIIEREVFWKESLLSRVPFGYNKN